MIKAEPKTILYFLWNYFDVVKDLFDVQSNDGIIKKELFNEILKKHDKDIKQQLIEYKILKAQKDDYELRDVYYKMLEFVLFEFRPMLPEEIAKFGMAIGELFKRIRGKSEGNREILLERIRALSTQIREFTDAVEKNSIRLLNETRDLKANAAKVDYREKIQRASFWIHYYIIPLNTILDVNHKDSVSNRLLEISEYANQLRLNATDEEIRVSFERLYFMLRQTNDDLLRQSKILTHELLPLIERIRTESIILTGFIKLLKNPYKIAPPKLTSSNKKNPISDKIYLSTKEYFEQFSYMSETFIDQYGEDMDKWLFKKDVYKKKLVNELPVENFFGWCMQQFNEDPAGLTNEKVFAVTSLLFDQDFEVTYSEKSKAFKVTTRTAKLNVPLLKITKNGIPGKTQVNS